MEEPIKVTRYVHTLLPPNTLDDWEPVIDHLRSVQEALGGE